MEKNEITAESLLAKLNSQSNKVKETKESAIPYSTIYKSIKYGIFASAFPHFRKTFLFKDILKKTEADYCTNTTSNEPEKKSIRKFFQDMHNGQGLSAIEKKEKRNECFADLQTLVNLYEKKSEAKKINVK